MRLDPEEQYDELLKAADEMEEQGLITSAEWRQLVRDAGNVFTGDMTNTWLKPNEVSLHVWGLKNPPDSGHSDATSFAFGCAPSGVLQQTAQIRFCRSDDS